MFIEPCSNATQSSSCTLETASPSCVAGLKAAGTKNTPKRTVVTAVLVGTNHSNTTKSPPNLLTNFEAFCDIFYSPHLRQQVVWPPNEYSLARAHAR